jgi:hypothetical protein
VVRNGGGQWSISICTLPGEVCDPKNKIEIKLDNNNDGIEIGDKWIRISDDKIVTIKGITPEEIIFGFDDTFNSIVHCDYASFKLIYRKKNEETNCRISQI